MRNAQRVAGAEGGVPWARFNSRGAGPPCPPNRRYSLDTIRLTVYNIAMAEGFLPYPLLMQPYPSARPWGGRLLETRLHKIMPADGGPWGEAWELSDHPDGRSTIANGLYAGVRFGELVRRFPESVGRAEPPRRFPLIVKYIDAAEDLSIQVHPNDEFAPVGESGKSECWFIMDCREGGEIVHGLRDEITPERLAAACRAGAVEPCLRRVPIHPGDFVQIPPGTVHAILAGTLLCEIQQCSNTTYRLWDWDRRPARPLHVDEACRVTDYSAAPPPPTPVGALDPGRWHTLVAHRYFEISTISWPARATGLVDCVNDHGLIFNIVDGDGEFLADGFRVSMRLGQTWFLPAGMTHFLVSTREPLRFLATRSLQL